MSLWFFVAGFAVLGFIFVAVVVGFRVFCVVLERFRLAEGNKLVVAGSGSFPRDQEVVVVIAVVAVGITDVVAFVVLDAAAVVVVVIALVVVVFVVVVVIIRLGRALVVGVVLVVVGDTVIVVVLDVTVALAARAANCCS